MMLSLLFVYLLIAKATAAPATDDGAQASCKDIDNCRTLLNIIWSCITTIFLCTWVSIHPNIPEPIDTDRMSFFKKVILAIRRLISDKLPLFICALFVPEYILAWALRQYLVARKLAKKNHLSTTHGFFIIMGGFHYFPEGPIAAGSSHTIENNSHRKPLPGRLNGTRTKQKMARPLDRKEVISMVNSGAITLPTKAEIKDKSKSDWIAKTIVLLQTTWFIIQCVARNIERLPTTELEIVTLAYTVINFGIFVVWWNKPQSVDCPIRVSRAPSRTGEEEVEGLVYTALRIIVGNQDECDDLHSKRKVPRFYGGDMDADHVLTADLITLLVGVAFGAIHCIAWSFEFPSYTETQLWRFSSASITSVPFFFLAVAILLQLNRLLFLVLPLCGVLYVAARLTTLVLAFMNLSSSPPGVFQAVHWTTLIPHV